MKVKEREDGKSAKGCHFVSVVGGCDGLVVEVRAAVKKVKKW